MQEPDTTIRVGQLEIRYLQHASGELSSGCFEMVIPPGSNVPPPHRHADSEEIVVVLEGTLRYRVGDLTRDLRPGESMGTPRGAVHAFSNPHPAPVRALVINTPDIGVGYFREVAEVVNAGGPPDKARIASIMARHGLQLAA